MIRYGKIIDWAQFDTRISLTFKARVFLYCLALYIVMELAVNLLTCMLKAAVWSETQSDDI